MYNPASGVNRRKLVEMAAMGFEIGLHFDPTVYGDADREALHRHAGREAEILSAITGCKVKSLSLHNPAIDGRFPTFDGFVNAYSEEIYCDQNYLSDSRMDFRGKNPFEFVRRAAAHPVQVLLHPIHYSQNGDRYPDLFYRMLKHHIGEVDREARLNATYAGQMPGSLRAYAAAKESAP